MTYIFGEVLFANIHSTKLAVLFADKNGVKIADYNNYLNLASSNDVFFDKTGVLTDCDGIVTEITGDKQLTLSLAVSAMQSSNSHVARYVHR